MARSHVCTRCGLDLARLRSVPDAHYGLPVVVCPACGAASVRRPYAGAARWRSARRAASTAGHAAIRLSLLFLLPSIALTAAAGIAQGLEFVLGADPAGELLSLDPRQRARLDDWLSTDGSWIIPAWFISSVAAGAIVGIAFPHWRVRWWLLGIAAVTALVLVLPPPIAAAREFAHTDNAFFPAWVRNVPGRRDLILTLAPFAGGVALSAAAMPAGLRLGRTLVVGRGLRSRRLKRARAKWRAR